MELISSAFVRTCRVNLTYSLLYVHEVVGTGHQGNRVVIRHHRRPVAHVGLSAGMEDSRVLSDNQTRRQSLLSRISHRLRFPMAL